MSDWTIFAVGLSTSILLGGGLFYTVREFYIAGKSMEREEGKQRKGSAGDRPDVRMLDDIRPQE